MKNLLLLTTYPIAIPRHGGQVRASSVAKAYGAAGWNVSSLAVYAPESFSSDEVGPLDVAFPESSPYRRFNGRFVPLITDLTSGAYASADDGALAEIQSRLAGPGQVIHIEQPWLWPLAARLRAAGPYRGAKIVFGSQNIEAPLKRMIVTHYHFPDCDDIIDAIESLETDALQGADVVAAVTEADSRALSSRYPRRIILAPNGIQPWHASAELLENWRPRLPAAPFALYVASAYTPNFTDAKYFFNASLGCIPPDTRLVVAGSVCEHLYREFGDSRWQALNWSRMQLLFHLSDEDLGAVKSLAHVFLLPIASGGGSNIKTAEAIYSGAHVVGSTTAFRGFGQYLNLPELNVAATPAEFQAGVRRLLCAPRAEADPGPRAALAWEHCLAALVEAVGDLEVSVRD